MDPLPALCKQPEMLVNMRFRTAFGEGRRQGDQQLRTVQCPSKLANKRTPPFHVGDYKVPSIWKGQQWQASYEEKEKSYTKNINNIGCFILFLDKLKQHKVMPINGTIVIGMTFGPSNGLPFLPHDSAHEKKSIHIAILAAPLNSPCSHT